MFIEMNSSLKIFISISTIGIGWPIMPTNITGMRVGELKIYKSAPSEKS